MILDANICQSRAPTLYFGYSTAQVSAILNPRLGDIAFIVTEGVFGAYRLEDSDAEIDGTYVLSSNACAYVWVLAGFSGGGATGAGLYSGIGSPEGVVAATVGSLYTDITDPDHPVQWKKTSGGATNTGWFQELAT